MGLIKSYNQSITLNPYPVIHGMIQTRVNDTDIAISSGSALINEERVKLSALTKKLNTNWASGNNQGCQIGTWGNGSQFLYCGINSNYQSDYFASHLATVSTFNGYTLQLIGGVYVNTLAIRPFVQSRNRVYWFSTYPDRFSGEISTTANTEIVCHVPAYDGFIGYTASSGYPVTGGNFGINIFSSVAPKPLPAQQSSGNSAFNADIAAFNSSPLFFTSVKADVHYSNNGRLLLRRVGSAYQGVNNHTTLRVESYLMDL